jgi:hypothetical protein
LALDFVLHRMPPRPHFGPWLPRSNNDFLGVFSPPDMDMMWGANPTHPEC